MAGKQKILIVDDDENIAELIELLPKFRVKEAVEIIVGKYSANKKLVYRKALEIKDKIL